METFSALLDLCAGNSLVTAEFPAQRPVTWSFDVFFHLCLNKRLSKQSLGWWFETPSRPLWRHCNAAKLQQMIWRSGWNLLVSNLQIIGGRDLPIWKGLYLTYNYLIDWNHDTKPRCRRSSSTQEQRYPPPLPLGATAPPTCGRRKSDPGLRVTTQDQEYSLRKLQEIRDVNLIAGYLYAIYYMKT